MSEKAGLQHQSKKIEVFKNKHLNLMKFKRQAWLLDWRIHNSHKRCITLSWKNQFYKTPQLIYLHVLINSLDNH